MSQVRVTVKLTNAIDEGLISRGLLAPNLLRECQTPALVSTGALTLVIPPEIVEQLGLRLQGRQTDSSVNGHGQNISVTEPVTIICFGRQTTIEALVVGDEVLIGQVVLHLLDLLPNWQNQRLIPNPNNPDYSVASV